MLTIKSMRNVKNFLLDESGMGVVEILLITVVLIAMVLKITSLVNKIWTSIGKSAKKIY